MNSKFKLNDKVILKSRPNIPCIIQYTDIEHGITKYSLKCYTGESDQYSLFTIEELEAQTLHITDEEFELLRDKHRRIVFYNWSDCAKFLDDHYAFTMNCNVTTIYTSVVIWEVIYYGPDFNVGRME